jgi:UDP-GlcNAc:undecaprenyl-phosphate GlcNAc-1-phosphate transferase
VAVVVLAVLTLRFTRRTKGFKATPTDFLILFLALVFPYLLANYIPFENPSMAAVRIIVLFFGYEVLIGELRTKVVSLSEATIPSLAMIVFRGLAGW